jgi:Tol biopolymer transport system component
MNIWMTEWINNKWGNPIPLNESINAVQQENEEWPSSNENFIFSLDGKSFLYTTMLRGDNSINIYEVNKTGEDFSTPKKINGLFESEKTWKYSAVMSPDGNFLFFNSYNADDGFGGEDIYVSKKMAEGWSRAKNIGAIINTSAQESSPRFSPDGKYFFFGREFRENPEKDGIWNIFFIETKYLNLNELF